MNNQKWLEHLAVCTWSLQPRDPAELLEKLEAIGIGRVQLALDPIRDEPAIWGDLPERLASSRIEIVSAMFGTVGEDYSTMESIRRTGGVVPDATWEQNWQNIQATAALAQRLGIRLVTFHAGFLPHDAAEPAYDKLLDRIARIADLFGGRGLELGFETGQETAATLDEFLRKLNRRQVGVNFDPANMILYDKGDPIQALRDLIPWLKQCHVKDARKTRTPGTWGDEVVVGTGEVDWRAFFATLEQAGFSGHLAIEREAGDRRVEDIRAARQFIEGLIP